MVNGPNSSDTSCCFSPTYQSGKLLGFLSDGDTLEPVLLHILQGFLRQALNLLGYALMVNSLAVRQHLRQATVPLAG